MQANRLVKIDDNISLILSNEQILSSEVYLIKGEKNNYFFDVGSDEESKDFLQTNYQNGICFISHFHQDHISNGQRLTNFIYYGSKQSQKYLPSIKIISTWEVQDGINLKVGEIKSSHAKGTLYLLINEDVLLLGDALYGKIINEKNTYNAQLLKEEIVLLEKLPFNRCFLSHQKASIYSKSQIINYLRKIYEKRNRFKAEIESNYGEEFL